MSEPNRQRIMRVSRELLVEVLKLPPGTRLVDISCHVLDCFFRDEVALKIEHPDFDPVPPEDTIPEVWPEYRMVTTDVPHTAAEFCGFRAPAHFAGVITAPPMTAEQVAEVRAARPGQIVVPPTPNRGYEFL